MPTGELITNIYNKILLSEQKMKTHFMTFLRDMIADMTSAAFLQSGVLDDETIDITSSSNDTFTLDITNAERVLDEEGNIVDLSGAASSSLYTDYPFENQTGQTYYVGIRYQSVPSGAEPNPRTGEAEYPYYEDTWGELDQPDSVTDNTTYIRLVLNSILESGVDHSGRPVRVYLVNPVSAIAAKAFYDGTVAYSSPNNYVDIPYTVSDGPLGQQAPYTISLTASDYRCHVQGVSWFKNTDLRTDPDYAFIGIITGNGPSATPTTFDMSDQRPVFLISLDRAYRANSTDTPAPGRQIFADKWAVEIKQSATSGYQKDPLNTALLINKIGESIDGGIGCGVLLDWAPDSSYTFIDYKNVADAASGGDLEPIEVVNLANPDLINFTRGGVDLSATGTVDFLVENAMILVSDTASDAQDGLYVITSVTSSTQVQVVTLAGASPAFSNESSVNARVLLPMWYRKTLDLLDTTYSSDESHMMRFAKARDGAKIQSMGLPLDDNIWLSCGSGDETDQYDFFKMLPGRAVMYGGGMRSVQSKTGFYTQPMFQIEKRDTSDLSGSDWVNVAGEDWGFDYHCGDYSKAASTNTPDTHLDATFRHPFWYYNAGTVIDEEEAFTQVDSETLDLTGLSASASAILMGRSSNDPTVSPGPNWMLVEIAYSPTSDGDGVYWIYDVDDTTDQIVLRTLNGGSPSLPSGSGTLRIYGGCFFGTTPSEIVNSSVDKWAATITCPNVEMGGLRINQPQGKLQLLLASADETQLYVWGGEVYGKGYKFIDTVSKVRSISVELGHAFIDPSTNDFWNRYPNYTLVGKTTNMWRNDMTAGGTQNQLTLPVIIPDGATITQIDLQVYVSITPSSNLTIELYSMTGSSNMVSESSTASSSGSGWQTVSLTSLSVTVDNDTKAYTLVVTPAKDTGSALICAVAGEMSVAYDIDDLGIAPGW